MKQASATVSVCVCVGEDVGVCVAEDVGDIESVAVAVGVPAMLCDVAAHNSPVQASLQ